MGLFDRVTGLVRPWWLLRALVRELRLTRETTARGVEALERIARALERTAPAHAGAQVFRVGRHEPLSDRELHAETAVAYVDPVEQARLLDLEENLRIVLGRDPTEAELEAQLR